MNSRITLLGVLLLAQLIMVAVLWTSSETDGDAAPQRLLTIQPDAVTGMTITAGDDELSLQEAAGQWQAHRGALEVPANAEKVEALLDTLGELTATWPVATSQSSAERFEVADDNFQRRLVLETDGKPSATLYLGTSPGFQRVHARLAGEQDIYSVGLSNYQVSVELDDWLAKDLLALSQVPQRVALEVIDDQDGALRSAVLEQTDQGWQFDGNPADSDKAEAYVQRFTTLQVLGIGPDGQDGQDGKEAQPVARILVSTADGERALLISQAGASNDYIVQDARGGQPYRLASYIAEQLLMTDTDFAVAGDSADADLSSESTATEGE